MRNAIFLLIFTIMFSSCAPLPGNALLPGVSELSKIDEVEVRLHKDDFISTAAKCFSLMREYSSTWYVTKIALISAGFIPACTLPWIDTATGKVVECDIYYSADMFLEHERAHCEGRADVLY